MKDHSTNNKSWKRNLIIYLIIINLSIISNNKLEEQRKLNEITDYRNFHYCEWNR